MIALVDDAASTPGRQQTLERLRRTEQLRHSRLFQAFGLIAPPKLKVRLNRFRRRRAKVLVDDGTRRVQRRTIRGPRDRTALLVEAIVVKAEKLLRESVVR